MGWDPLSGSASMCVLCNQYYHETQNRHKLRNKSDGMQNATHENPWLIHRASALHTEDPKINSHHQTP